MKIRRSCGSGHSACLTVAGQFSIAGDHALIRQAVEDRTIKDALDELFQPSVCSPDSRPASAQPALIH